jgi:hypothetical protein
VFQKKTIAGQLFVCALIDLTFSTAVAHPLQPRQGALRREAPAQQTRHYPIEKGTRRARNLAIEIATGLRA